MDNDDFQEHQSFELAMLRARQEVQRNGEDPTLKELMRRARQRSAS